LLALGARRLRRLGRGSDETGRLEADLDRLRESGTTLTMAFSESEPLFEELSASGILGRLGNWPNVELTRLPGNDHTLRPIDAQAGAREMLDRGLMRALGGGGFRASSTPSKPAAERVAGQAGRQR
jgi:hypothetical protein